MMNIRTVIIFVGVFAIMSALPKTVSGGIRDPCRGFNVPHASCVVNEGGYSITCNRGYKMFMGTADCRPIISSDTGVEGTPCENSDVCQSSLSCLDNKCSDLCKLFAISHASCTTEHHRPAFQCDDGWAFPDFTSDLCLPIR